jgi:hypothetical protein
MCCSILLGNRYHSPDNSTQCLIHIWLLSIYLLCSMIGQFPLKKTQSMCF